jgi:histone deacetylase complex regulatory component SIN3
MAELVDAKYGENKVYEEQQRVMPAPEAQALPPAPAPNEVAQPPADAPYQQMPPIGPFNGPTERPTEPVTSGAPFGPGPNGMAMGPQGPMAPQALSRTLAQYGAADDTGVIAELAQYFDGMNI